MGADDLDIDSIALHYRVVSAGDRVRVGDVVCVSMEDEPSARIVGYLARNQPGMKVVIRCFAPGDGWIPTGEYRRCGLFWPWVGHAAARRRALEAAADNVPTPLNPAQPGTVSL